MITDYQQGIIDFASNCLAEVERVRRGDCTLEQMSEWIKHVQRVDGKEVVGITAALARAEAAESKVKKGWRSPEEYAEVEVGLVELQDALRRIVKNCNSQQIPIAEAWRKIESLAKGTL